MRFSSSPKRFVAAATVSVMFVGTGLFGQPSAMAAPGTQGDSLSQLNADSPVKSLASSVRTKDDDNERQSGSFTINGKLVDEQGAALANKDVQIDLYPGPDMLNRTITTDEPALNLPIGHDVTDADGVFRVQVPALRNIDEYYDRSGDVRLLISSVSADHSLFYDVSAKLSRDSNVIPTITTAADTGVVGAAASDAAASAASSVTPEAEAGLSMALDDLLLRADTQSSSGPASAGRSSALAADPDPQRLCLESVGIHTYGWKLDSTGQKVNTPIQVARTLGRTNAVYEWDDVKTIEVTTGWDLAYKQAKSKGGFTKTSEAGLGGKAVVRANARVYIETGVEYRWNRLYCYRPQAIYANVAVSIPYKVMGGAVNRSTPRADVACRAGIASIDISIGNSVKVSHRSTIKLLAGLNVAGISLDAAQTNNSVNTMIYSAPGRSPAKICGNNGYVQSASVVRESSS